LKNVYEFVLHSMITIWCITLGDFFVYELCVSVMMLFKERHTTNNQAIIMWKYVVNNNSYNIITFVITISILFKMSAELF